MDTVTKRVKIARHLAEKTFQEMRSDYSQHILENFPEYRKNFESIAYLAKHLINDPPSKEDD